MTRPNNLPILVSYDSNRLVHLNELALSLIDEKTEQAFVARLGVERGGRFIKYARDQDIKVLVKVFCVEPVAQLKTDLTKRGRGTDLYDAAVIEEALFVAFNSIFPLETPAPVFLPPL